MGVAGRRITRRQALRAGAVAAALGAVRLPSPALAARPALFELDLPGEAVPSAGWRTTPVLRAPGRFDLAGLRWDADAHAEAQLRARPRGGDWTPWVTLHPLGDHGPDGGTPAGGTEPAFTGAADELQLRVRGNPRGLRARFVRALPTASFARRAGARLRRRGASIARRTQRATTPFPLITRAEWGAASVPPRAEPAYGDVQLAFVHHTVTANAYGPEDSAGIVLGIARYHRDGNGWNDIGYNFLVDRYGQIFEGRGGGVGLPVVGAHAQGFNAVSTGVACLGTFEAVAVAGAGMRALARVIGWKLALHGVPVTGNVTVVSAGGDTNRWPAGTPVRLRRISGHRDGDLTRCPGGALYAQLPGLRRRARRYARPRTGLSLHARTRSTAYDAPVTLSGTLRSGPPAAPIVLEFQSGGAPWTPVSSAVTDDGGRWSVAVVPPASGVFRAVFLGDASHDREVSRSVRVDVIPRLSLSLDARGVRRGSRVTITGTVQPDAAVQVVVERRVGAAWKTGPSGFARVRDGRFGLRVRLRTPGAYRVTAIAGTTRRRRTLRAG